MSTKIITRCVLGAAAASVSVVMLAACSSSRSPNGAGAGASGSPTTGAGTSSTSTSALKTESTSIGTVAADPSGLTLYELVGNSAASPKCTGTCLSVWPPVMVNGTQVVLQGHPAYTFSEDKSPGQVTGEGAKDQWGTWYALNSSGAPITSAASTGGSSSSSGGGGGYGY